jgi:phosphatidylglycerol:prolipoprotein diacylglycerol transferase
MLGGRLGSFLLYHPEQILADPLSFLRIWEGGMASHGAFIGVAIALWLFSRKTKISFLHVGDVIVSTAALGLTLGRIANFINGELWGHESTVAWAVIFPESAPLGTSPADIPPRHPSQLYQAFLEGAVLLAYMQHRVWRNRVMQTHPGQLSGEFLVGYAIARSIGEIFREPDAALILGLSRGTFYSLFVLIAGIALIALTRKTKPRPDRRGL